MDIDADECPSPGVDSYNGSANLATIRNFNYNASSNANV